MNLEARNLVFGYDQRRVVDGVSLTVSGADRLAIVGPNGSGKSTLLKLLSGFLSPEEGSIHLDGKKVRSLGERERSRALAYLPQQVNTYFPFTALEMVQMAISAHENPLFEHVREDTRALDALRRVGLDKLSRQPYAHLSGGEQKLTLIARMLAQPGDCLLLDEPIASLDLGHAERVLTLLRSKAESGRTVVAVMHNLNLALAWFDRFVLLDRGKCIVEGDATALLSEGQLESVYKTRLHRIPHPESGRTFLLTDDGHPSRRS